MCDISAGLGLFEVAKEGGGMPTAEACAQAIMRRCVSCAGFPKATSINNGPTQLKIPGCCITWSGNLLIHWQG